VSTNKIIFGAFIAFAVPETDEGIAGKKEDNDGKIDSLHKLVPGGN
jgi:hypothetical protein